MDSLYSRCYSYSEKVVKFDQYMNRVRRKDKLYESLLIRDDEKNSYQFQNKNDEEEEAEKIRKREIADKIALELIIEEENEKNKSRCTQACKT